MKHCSVRIIGPEVLAEQIAKLVKAEFQVKETKTYPRLAPGYSKHMELGSKIPNEVRLYLKEVKAKCQC